MPPRSAVDRVHEVYATSYRRLVGQVTGVTGDPVEAQDAVMEAFARAVSSGRSFLVADDPEAWLRTVAVDVTRTRWRRGLAAESRASAADFLLQLPAGRWCCRLVPGTAPGPARQRGRALYAAKRPATARVAGRRKSLIESQMLA